MTTFISQEGMSIYDVCLSTYGVMDFITKLMLDNGFSNCNTYPSSGQIFVYDETLITDLSTVPAKVYATANRTSGSLFSYPTVIPVQVNYKEMTTSTSYTSVADGTTLINVVDDSGNPIVGYDIVQITKETKPFFKTQYSWNKNTSVLSLINGTTLDKDATLFIIYTKTAS